MKTAFNFLVSRIPYLIMREDLGMFIDEEVGDLDDESDVELDGNDQLKLDLYSESEHNGWQSQFRK